MTMSPIWTFSAPSTSSASTTPTPVPETSYSSAFITPGCSAISPPMSAQQAYRQPSAMPPQISATRSGTTSPQAM